MITEELDKTITMQSLTHDIMLKNLFERNIYAFKRFLISTLHLNIYPNDCTIHFLDKELPIINYKEYKKRVDFNVSINNYIYVNIELNRTNFKNIKYRNHLYHNKQVSYSLKKGQAITDIENYKTIQLNLNAFDKSNHLGEDIIVPYSLKTESIYIENDIVYLKYLDYYYKLYYNEDVKKEESDYWLALLMSKNFTELNDILSKFLEDNIREKIVKDVYELSMDEFILEDIEREALDAIERRDTMENLKAEVLEEGRKEGIEQKTIEMVKSMLENKIDYELISKVTKKSIKEIKKIEKS